MTKDTGGPAFPAPAGVSHITEQGMTLRDYFAAKAMQSLISELADWKYMPNEIAKFAYVQADAMLKARQA